MEDIPQLVEIVNLPEIIDYSQQLSEIISQLVTIGNVLIGLVIGYIAVRGFFAPWTTSD